jgi:hypothetical protein
MNQYRWLFGSLGSAFIVGVIFWAGATYNRISGIEGRLVSIESALLKLSNLSAIEVRVEEHQRRLDSLDRTVQQLR